MVIPGCQLDMSGINYNPEMKDTPVIQVLKQEGNMLLIQPLKLDDTHL